MSYGFGGDIVLTRIAYKDGFTCVCGSSGFVSKREKRVIAGTTFWRPASACKACSREYILLPRLTERP